MEGKEMGMKNLIKKKKNEDLIKKKQGKEKERK